MRHILSTLLFCASAQVAAPMALAETAPVVVELYTSQGCSSCPPADAMLRELAKRDGVIALALHVDYWDYIGWADSFAQPAFTIRQKAYARAAGARMVYTPQMIIGGRDHVIGTKPMDVMDHIERHRGVDLPVAVELVVSGDMVRIEAQSQSGAATPCVVQVVRYEPSQTVEIHRGENAGRTLDYVNIVTSWDVIGEWDGAEPFVAEVPRGAGPVVVMVQGVGHGPVLGAAELR